MCTEKKKYDPFVPGDRIWCEMYGFGVIDKDFDAKFPYENADGTSHRYVPTNEEGIIRKFESTGRHIYHAVCSTHAHMIDAVNHTNAPLFRKRKRFPIRAGDRLLYVSGSIDTCQYLDRREEPIRCFGRDFYVDGRLYAGDTFPRVIPLYKNEHPNQERVSIEEAFSFFGKALKDEPWEVIS